MTWYVYMRSSLVHTYTFMPSIRAPLLTSEAVSKGRNIPVRAWAYRNETPASPGCDSPVRYIATLHQGNALPRWRTTGRSMPRLGTATRVATGDVSSAQRTSVPAQIRRAMAPTSALLQTRAIWASVTDEAAPAFPSASVGRLGSRSRTAGFEQVPT